MDAILGLTPTGRELRDPAARLIEATDADDRTFTIVDFDAAHDGHPSLTLNVEMVISFMEYPMVTGLVECAKHDIPAGQFAYPTGSVWLLADVMRAFGDFGQVVGLRAAMELAWLVGQILVEAGTTGPLQGCFSHGNINPWRIALRADGEVQVLGYGLPQVELIRHRSGEGPALEASSLRYCPPERLEGVPEDPAADTYALALVAFELATGRPLLESFDIEELQRMVGMSEGATILSRDNKGLPPKVAKLLAKALVYDPETRLSGKGFVDAVGMLLASEPMKGPSLTEVVSTLQGRQKAGAPKGRKLVSTASTSMYTPEQLAALVDQEEDERKEDEAQSGEGDDRWKKVERSRNASEDEDKDEVPKRQLRRGAGEAEPAPRRKRRRGKSDNPVSESTGRRRKPHVEEKEAEPVVSEPVVSEPVVSEPVVSEPEPKARKRTRKAPAEDAAVEVPKVEEAKVEAKADPAPKKKPKSSRRRRKKPVEEDKKDAAKEAEAPPERPVRRSRAVDEDEDDGPPRRRRRPVDDDDEDEPPRRRRAKT